MNWLKSIMVAGVCLLASTSSFAHGWQAAAMWDWALNTANPRLDAQEAQIEALQAQVDAIDAYTSQLQSYIEVDETTSPAQPVVRVVAANFQIVNGADSTSSITGTGNLIVGYDEVSSQADHCTIGYRYTQLDCENDGGTWGSSFKTGSHNVVIGTGHSYSSYGGFIAGAANRINGAIATVTGGNQNKASHIGASVTGGVNNLASGIYSSVSGGVFNTASGTRGSVSGGSHNLASGEDSSVTGGTRNIASGTESSVSGGYSANSSGEYDWRAGNLFETQ